MGEKRGPYQKVGRKKKRALLCWAIQEGGFYPPSTAKNKRGEHH